VERRRDDPKKRPVSSETGRRENCDEELFVFFLLFLTVALFAKFAVLASVDTAFVLAFFAGGFGASAACFVFQREGGTTPHCKRTGDDRE